MKKVLLTLIIVSTLITFTIFFPYSSRPTQSLPNSVDPVFYAWNLMHNVQSAGDGFKNLLDTNIFYPEGNTLALSDTLYAQSLLTSPVIILTHNPVLAENIYILATFPLAAIAMFFLCFYLTGSSWAAGLAGIFYAFSYPRLSQIGHMPALSSQWLPLVFLYLIKWIRAARFRDLFLLFFWYLASITSTLYFGIFLIPLSLIVLAAEITNNFGRLFRQFLIILIPASIIIVIVLFPYIRLRAEYPGIRRSVEDASRLSAHPKDYLTVLPTGWLSDLGLPTDTNERVLYPTLTLVTLALSSLILTEKKHRKTLFGFSGVWIAALVLSLGPRLGTTNLPYYYLYKIFPLLESIRVPARFSIFVILGLSVCGSFALAKIFQNPKSKAIAILLVLVFLAEIWQVSIPSVPIPTGSNVPTVYDFLGHTSGDSIIAELPLRPEWAGIRMENQLALEYKETNENDVYSLEAYRTYFSAFHRKRMLNGYSGYFPNIYHDHSIVLDTFPGSEAITMLEKTRVRYILVHSREYVNRPFAEILSGIGKFPQLKLVGTFGTDYLYELISPDTK